ncbi:protein takeout-like [Anastrepha obliqua]|uniref:protein takeout-like n=1 Tax=Anastrepha obliqua TaxID=95512 RepID=UPI0024091EB4|nr:protein takeout-like [Anastrepha obliqua]
MFTVQQRLALLAFLSSSCCLLLTSAASSNFPADIPRCRVADTDCITRTTINLVRQYARTGYPAAGFPTVEPFLIKRFDISDGRTGSLNLKLNFRDVNVEGLSGVQVDRTVGFERDPATSKFEFYGLLPKIILRGKYVADGRILILPIRGDGDADILLQNSKFSIKFKPALHPKDGKTYLSVDKLKVLVEPEKMSIKMTNLFNGDPALGGNLNEFLNQNWRDVWNELQPSIHVAIAEVIKSVLQTLFKRFAYEDLYADD